MIYEGDIQGILPFFVQNGKKIHQFEEKSYLCRIAKTTNTKYNIMKFKSLFFAAIAAVFTFAACEELVPETPETPGQEETPGDTENPGDTEEPGTPETPVVTYTSFADFNAAEVSTDVFYTVQGTIVSIEDLSPSANFNNATLTIADESGAQLYVYRMKPAEGGKMEEIGLTVGDVLVVKGNRGEYSGKIQMVNPVYVSHEDKEAPAVQIKDIALKAFNELADSNADLYRISGTIKEIGEINTQYNNVNVTITDAAGDEVYIYRLKVADDSDKTLQQLALKAGDVLTVVGNKGSYNGDPQMVNGKYESHVAGTTPPAGGEGEEPETPGTPVSGTVTLTNAEILALMTASDSSYSTYEISSTSGTWTVNAARNKANTFLQCRGKKGGFIKTPAFDKDIKSVTIHFTTAKQVYANNVYCAFPSTWTAPTADAAYPETGNVGKATTDGSQSLTIPVAAGNKQVYISIIGTYAYYLDHIDVAF